MSKKIDSIRILLIVLIILSIVSVLILLYNISRTENYRKINATESSIQTSLEDNVKIAKTSDRFIPIENEMFGIADATLARANRIVLDGGITSEKVNNKHALNIILAIDISSTMQKKDVDAKGTTRLEKAKDSAKVLVDNIFGSEFNNDVNFSLVAFDNSASIEVIGKGSEDKSYIIDEITKLPIDGYGTNMYDALVKVENVIETLKEINSTGENIIIFIGDGSPYGYDINNTYSGIIKKATELKEYSTIYTVGLGRDVAEVSKNPESGYYILSNMATEGNFSTATVGTELVDVFNNITNKLNNKL